VLTGMESGEWVEIIAGIKEGDQVVTSAQCLLDSEASLAGAIRRLDDLSPQPVEPPPQAILVSGRVEAVEPAKNRIRISHGPIDELAWPAMTMEFDVLDGVNLDQVHAGQDVRFTLRQQHAGEYAIEQLHTGEPAAGGDEGQ